jgi:hypothetical protein
MQIDLLFRIVFAVRPRTGQRLRISPMLLARDDVLGSANDGRLKAYPR